MMPVPNYLMNRTFVYSRAARLLVTAHILLLIVASASAAPRFVMRPTLAPHVSLLAVALLQNGLPVDPTEKPNNGDNKSGKPVEPREPRAPRTRVGRATSPAPARPAMHDVTFITDVPQVIIMQVVAGTRKPLGNTGTDKKLTVKLARGHYTITATNRGFSYQTQQIDVGTGDNNFSFKFATEGTAGNSDATNEKTDAASTETAAPKDSTISENALPEKAMSENTASGTESIIKRYLDMTANGNVTSDDWQTMLNQTTTALEKEPDSAELKAQKLFAEGQLSYSHNDYADALAKFNLAQLAQPNMAAVQYSLGTAYLATKQPREALKAFQQAARLDSDLALAQKGIGDALTQQGKSKEAQKFYDRAKSLRSAAASPSDTPAVAAAGVATAPDMTASKLAEAKGLMNRGRWSEALKSLQELSKTQATADVFTAIGDCYVGLKQPFSAAPAYKHATQLDPQSARAFYRYGTLTFEAREYETALDALERALALDQTGTTVNRKRAREMADSARKRLRKMQ